MRKRIHWSSSLKTVFNKKTNKHRYYISDCAGYWSRISCEEYTSREINSDRVDSFRTQVEGDLVHNFKTIYGTYICASH